MSFYLLLLTVWIQLFEWYLCASCLLSINHEQIACSNLLEHSNFAHYEMKIIGSNTLNATFFYSFTHTSINVLHFRSLSFEDNENRSSCVCCICFRYFCWCIDYFYMFWLAEKNVESAKYWLSQLIYLCVLFFFISNSFKHARNIFGHCVGTWVVKSCFFCLFLYWFKCNTSSRLF